MIEEMQRDERVIALATRRAPALETKFGEKRVRGAVPVPFSPPLEQAATRSGPGQGGDSPRGGGASVAV